ncbi:hypothetical protein [Streptomyces corynorhini]|uniref:Uncharacterized protein n=1 Tax=Streptomyces corynorhini TaxID=2282652 RepID=A0A370AZH1_9ACTN|nr:hypothetical protein [Streptomyces corynorhini]RDG34980.1 hypothetical protein DVH02_27675 [Streptomyces corynorhini]
MALICPHCKAAEAISYVQNEDGKTLFPCLFCDLPAAPSHTNHTVAVSAPCITGGCAGRVQDTYVYGIRGRLVTAERRPCGFCGSSRTGVRNAASGREHLLPDVRL